MAKPSGLAAALGEAPREQIPPPWFGDSAGSRAYAPQSPPTEYIREPAFDRAVPLAERHHEPSLFRLLLVVVGVHVFPCGLRGQLHGVQMVPVGKVRMVRCLFVIPSLVVFGRFLVMASRLLMVLGGLLVMFSGARRHGLLLSRSSPFSQTCIAPPLPVYECPVTIRHEPLTSSRTNHLMMPTGRLQPPVSPVKEEKPRRHGQTAYGDRQALAHGVPGELPHGSFFLPRNFPRPLGMIR